MASSLAAGWQKARFCIGCIQLQRSLIVSRTFCSTDTETKDHKSQAKDKHNAINADVLKTVSTSESQSDYESQQKEKINKANPKIDEDGSVDYSYFKHIISSSKSVLKDPSRTALNMRSFEKCERGGAKEISNNKEPLDDAGSNSGELTESMSSTPSNLIPGLKHLKPLPITTSATFAPYVNKSEVLRNLLSLGVDLTAVEKHRGAANLLLKCNWDEQVQPYLNFLYQIGVKDEDIGSVISGNPAIFLQNIEDLNIRIAYFTSKKFEKTAVAGIVTRAPQILSQSVKQTDFQLGYLQKDFKLTGKDVRKAITMFPRLTYYDARKLQVVKFHLKEELEFSDRDLRGLLLTCPRIFIKDKDALEDRYLYLINDMAISKDTIMKWPNVLSTRLDRIRQRHRFLQECKRDQYDQAKENYVSLQALVTGSNSEFCQNVAKVNESVFDNFLRTL